MRPSRSTSACPRSRPTPPGRSWRRPGHRSRSSSERGVRAVKVAVVGVGYWGPNLVRNLHTIPACDQVVVYDLDEARVKGILDHYQSTVAAASFDQIVSDPQVGAVVVATPVETHARLATQALEAGKSVLVEKPLAISSRDARALVELARTRGLLVMAGHTFLFSPPVLAVKRLIDQGQVGTPLYVQSSRVNLGIHRSDVDVIW